MDSFIQYILIILFNLFEKYFHKVFAFCLMIIIFD